MPRKKTKGDAVNIRPYAGDNELAQLIAEKLGIDKVVVMSMALSAGLRAIKAHGFPFPIPLTMEVTSPEKESLHPQTPGARMREIPLEGAGLNEPPAQYGSKEKKKPAKVLKLPGQAKENQ